MARIQKIFLWSGVALSLAGCATVEDQSLLQLSRQQTATIESLNAEVLRLNQELEGATVSRTGLESAQAELERNLGGAISRGELRVASEPRGLVVTVFDRSLFDPGETQLKTAATDFLDTIVAALEGPLASNSVSIEGHTDDQPVEGEGGITNWEYSIGRATAVLHYFIDNKGLAPERFEVVGLSEFHPLVSNDTEKGRDQNRRVEIVVIPEKLAETQGRS